jgi:hypothetical protein
LIFYFNHLRFTKEDGFFFGKLKLTDKGKRNYSRYLFTKFKIGWRNIFSEKNIVGKQSENYFVRNNQ